MFKSIFSNSRIKRRKKKNKKEKKPTKFQNMSIKIVLILSLIEYKTFVASLGTVALPLWLAWNLLGRDGVNTGMPKSHRNL